MTKQPKTLSKLKSEILQEFRNEIYGEDDALFDRTGNNVSTQVENFLSSALDTVAEKTVEAMELSELMDMERKGRNAYPVELTEKTKGYNEVVSDQILKRDNWLGRGK